MYIMRTDDLSSAFVGARLLRFRKASLYLQEKVTGSVILFPTYEVEVFGSIGDSFLRAFIAEIL